MMKLNVLSLAISSKLYSAGRAGHQSLQQAPTHVVTQRSSLASDATRFWLIAASCIGVGRPLSRNRYRCSICDPITMTYTDSRRRPGTRD